MKKIALVLVTITPFFTTFSAEKISFRDGTFLEASTYVSKGFEPDKDGVILTVDNKIYIHHYPCIDGSLSVPTFYYHGPNPYAMPTCTPSRISFYHFETFTLSKMRTKISRMHIPYKKKVEAVRAIDKAMSGSFPKVMTNPNLKNETQTKKWQASAEIYLGRRFKIGQAIWGKDLEPFEKHDINNRSLSLTKK